MNDERHEGRVWIRGTGTAGGANGAGATTPASDVSEGDRSQLYTGSAPAVRATPRFTSSRFKQKTAIFARRSTACWPAPRSSNLLGSDSNTPCRLCKPPGWEFFFHIEGSSTRCAQSATFSRRRVLRAAIDRMLAIDSRGRQARQRPGRCGDPPEPGILQVSSLRMRENPRADVFTLLLVLPLSAGPASMDHRYVFQQRSLYALWTN